MNAQKILRESGAAIKGDHFVYKDRTKHGHEYINKERFPNIGALNLVKVINEVFWQAFLSGLTLGRRQRIGIIGPAHGGVPYSLTAAAAAESLFTSLDNGQCATFFPARTYIDENDRHYVPEKLHATYMGADFIIFDDIVNNGTTVREVSTLFQRHFGDDCILGAICMCDRGGQTSESLGVKQYYPFMRAEMQQWHYSACPYCKQGRPINTQLGKGEKLVKLFGQPPYAPGTDFSAFLQADD